MDRMLRMLSNVSFVPNGMTIIIRNILFLMNMYLLYFYNFSLSLNGEKKERIAYDYALSTNMMQWFQALFYYFYSENYMTIFWANVVLSITIGYLGFALDYHIGIKNLMQYLHIGNIVFMGSWLINAYCQIGYLDAGSYDTFMLLQIFIAVCSQHYISGIIQKKISTVYP